MDRFTRHAMIGLGLGALVIATAAGCNLVATAMYVISGQNVAAD